MSTELRFLLSRGKAAVDRLRERFNSQGRHGRAGPGSHLLDQPSQPVVVHSNDLIMEIREEPLGILLPHRPFDRRRIAIGLGRGRERQGQIAVDLFA